MNLNKKNLSIFLLITIIIIGAIYYLLFFKSSEDKTPDTEETQVEIENSFHPKDMFVYTDPTTKQSISVNYSTNASTARLDGFGYTAISLDIATSASGAYYVNEKEKLELWNKGSEVTVWRGEKSIFSGNVGGLSDDNRLSASKWVWFGTIINGSKIDPKIKDAFVLSFDEKEGVISITTDCNTVFGPYKIGAENKLSFGTLGMTKKFCKDSQESIFVDHLSEVTGYELVGSDAITLELGLNGYMIFNRKFSE